MNTKIKELLQQIEDNKWFAASLKEQLQKEYNKVFDASKELAEVISEAQDSSDYITGEYGDILSYYHFYGLSDYAECKEYFENWLSETHCMRVDWQNDCLLVNHGDDNLIIQDDTRHDNGIWQSGKCIIDEAEYKDEDGEVNEAKRNELIEAYMERTGFFPGVFSVDYHGNVSFVNTKKKS